MNSLILSTLVALLACTAFAQKNVMSKAVGPCINDACPMPGHTCYYGQCVPSTLNVNMKFPKKAEAVGPCINGLCPTPKTYCHQSECYREPKDLYD